MFRTHFMALISIAPYDKSFHQFCNALRCPLCQSQLDGNIHPKKADLYCAANNAEYKVQYLPGEDTPFLEQISYWYTQYQYDIIIHRRSPNTFETRIDRLNLDLHRFHRHSSRTNVFHYTGERILFFRSRMDEDVFLKKLKTYNLFS